MRKLEAAMSDQMNDDNAKINIEKSIGFIGANLPLLIFFGGSASIFIYFFVWYLLEINPN